MLPLLRALVVGWFATSVAWAQSEPVTVTLRCMTDTFARAASEAMSKVIEEQIKAANNPIANSVRVNVRLYQLQRPLKVSAPAFAFSGTSTAIVSENPESPRTLTLSFTEGSVNSLLTNIEGTACAQPYGINARVRYRKLVDGKSVSFSGRYRSAEPSIIVNGVFAK